MAYTNNLNYIKVDGSTIIGETIFRAQLLSGTKDYPGPFFSVLPGNKGTIRLVKGSTEIGMQAGGCDTTPVDDDNFDPRDVTVCLIKCVTETCKDLYVGDQWVDAQPFTQAAGASNNGPNATLQSWYRDEKLRIMKFRHNLMLIQGDPDVGYGDQNLCPGLIWRMNDTAGDPTEAAAVVKIDGDPLTTGNLLTKLNDVYLAADPVTYQGLYNGEDDGDVRFLVSPKTEVMLWNALSSQNANFPGLIQQTRNNVARFYLNGIPIFGTVAMPDDQILLYNRRNVIFTTDLENDLEAVRVTDLSENNPADNRIQFYAQYFSGIHFLEGKLLTWYRIP